MVAPVSGLVLWLRLPARLLCAISTAVCFAVSAQTLTLTGGVQKFGSLTGTTVNMSGKCELWVTNASSPLSGCTINLDSVDSWLFLPAVKPSVVSSAYLGQVRVSGAPAALGSSVRVAQYGQSGAVVIPQPATFLPLTTFTGAEFTGVTRQYGQWTYYRGTGVANISSFILKRGYQAVLAQSANGANYSKCYVAQDGDLEVGVLPASLDQRVQFIYVTPWRWSSKKGIAGNPGFSLLNVNWWYDWNLDQCSSPDLEYVGIWQQPNWPSLNQNWRSLGIGTVLGFNEPDNSSQDAYKNLIPPGSVNDAVARLPQQLATGLRVGSPATTDGGRSGWLYPFVQQAESSGYRVDFIAIHYYWGWNPADPAGAANQMYNFLLDIWNNTHRPIWITEWNNGANWTDNNPYPPPTYAQQQACVAAMTQMLESAPFVERYALYNWVEDVRSLVTSSNTVTPAGTTYSNLVSNLAYAQAMPDNGTAGIAEFLFATNTWDSSGHGNNGMAIGAPTYGTGHNSQAQAILLDGTNSYVQLPGNLANGSAFTFAGWVYWNGGKAWQRIFDFGNDTSHYLFCTPNSGPGTLRFVINNGGGEQIVERPGALVSGSWQHLAVTLNGNLAVLYLNGAPVASSTGFSIAPSNFNPVKNYFGKSQFPADPLFNGNLDEVEIADYAMSAAQISALYRSAQYPALTGGRWANDASGIWSALTNWAGGMTANGAGFIADFSALDLSADRTVTLDSPRVVGGLAFGDLSGAHNWTLTGPNKLTLDNGSPNAPTISVRQNIATVSTPLAGISGLAKTGDGTLVLNGVNSLGGGLTVNGGSVNVTGGSTIFGNGTSSIGYLIGSGDLSLNGSSLAMGGELRVGASDQSGTQYNAAGTLTLTNANLYVGALTVARGNYLDNSVSGAVALNSGSTLISTNDVILHFAGAGLGKLELNGGNLIIGPAVSKWFIVGYWDSGAAELDVAQGTLLLENGSSLKLCRGNNSTGANVINQLGGAVTFYSDAGMTVGGGGNLDLNYAGGASSSSTYNLDGGILTVPQIIASSPMGARVFNFNGGTLRPTGSSLAFMAAGVASAANIRNGAAVIDTAGFNLTIAQALQHSAIAGDNPLDGGLLKLGTGTLTLNGANTYTGPTMISGGTLALGAGPSLANSRTIDVSTGAVLDVSQGGYTLGSSQTLTGGGTIRGILTINGMLVPGTSTGSSVLSFYSPPILNGTTVLELNRTNSPNSTSIVLNSSALTYGGALVVTNYGPVLQSGDSFTLFQAGGFNGSFATLNLPALGAGLAWNTNGLSSGILSVVSTVATNPVALGYALAGNSLVLSWPADHVGWRLVNQTNNLASGLSLNPNDWGTIANSQQTNRVVLLFDSSKPAGFYRLLFP